MGTYLENRGSQSDAQSHHEIQPGQRRRQRLPHLLLVKMSFISGRPINCQSSRSDLPLPLVEEPRGCCVPRHQHHKDNTASNGQASEDEKDGSPALNRHLGTADSVHQKSTNDLTDSVHRHPRRHSNRVLAATIPVGSDDDKGRRDSSLGETQKEPRGGEAVKVLSSSDGHFNTAPDDDGSADEHCDVEATEDVGGGVFGGELAEVEEGYDPGELFTGEFEIRLEAEDGGVVDGAFVEVCKKICQICLR